MFRGYGALARLFPRLSYVGKLSVVAFACVHAPLAAALLYVALSNQSHVGAVLATVLAATVLGTAGALAAVRALVRPVEAVSDALEAYATTGARPSLPTHYSDSAGQLMARAQAAIDTTDGLLRYREHLIRIASHDGCNAAGSVLLALELLTDALDPSDGEARELVALAETSARQLADLLADVLPAGGAGQQLQLVASLVAPSDLLDEVRAQAEARARDKGVSLVVDTAQAPAHRVPLDPVKMRQALANLAHNAVKFTPAGGRVRLACHAAGDRVVFTVEDTGVGMDAAQQADLFRPFTRAQRDGTDGESGRGLGLWITRQFAELHGGTVLVASRPGEGTRMSVALPLGEPQPATPALAA